METLSHLRLPASVAMEGYQIKFLPTIIPKLKRVRDVQAGHQRKVRHFPLPSRIIKLAFEKTDNIEYELTYLSLHFQILKIFDLV